MSLFKHKVEPILDAARCAYKVVRKYVHAVVWFLA
jgi:hypothetical protein